MRDDKCALKLGLSGRSVPKVISIDSGFLEEQRSFGDTFWATIREQPWFSGYGD